MKSKKPGGLTASGENYLEAVLMIQLRQGLVRSVDLARQLGVRKPSVSVMVHALEEAGYLVLDDAKYLHLTETGREIAESVYEKHQFFTKALVSLGVEPDTAEADACRIEHVVSDRTFSILKAFCGERAAC